MKKEKMLDNNYLQIGIVVFLMLLLLGNIGNFFFFKNSTRDLRVAVARIDNDILDESRKLALVKSEFAKRYNLQSLQEMAKKYLNLQFSQVQQIQDFGDILR